VNNPNSDKDMEVPKDIAPFVAKCPPLLPGESEAQYYSLFDMMMEEIRPDATEWLALADIVGLCWDVVRYRAWKGALLNIHRLYALERALRDTRLSRGAGLGEAPVLIGIARKEAEEWRTDPEKRKVLEARLAEYGYDEVALNAGALLEALVPIAAIERFLASARSQLNGMLKELCMRREFADRARKALNERLQPAAHKQIEAH